MMEKKPEQNRRIPLSARDNERVVGGTDYSYAYTIIGEMCVQFQTLINDGMEPDAARARVRTDYYDRVLDICYQYPDECGPEKQAEIIFMFTIGG